MDEGTGRRARRPGTLIAIAIGGVLLRLVHLLVPNAVPGFNLDPSVYYGAAGLLVTGRLPYADFALLHPPGILLILAPVAWLGEHLIGHAAAFALAAAGSAIAAGGTILGLGTLVARWRGARAGALAALLYATFLPAVVTEGDVLLEPFVDLLFVAAALRWLSPRPPAGRVVTTGALVALATAVKLTGAVAGIGCLASGPFGRPVRDRALLCAAAAAVTVAIVGPFALAAGPDRVWDQVVTAQGWRPPGGTDGGNLADPAARVLSFLGVGPLGLVAAATPAGSGSPLALLLLAPALLVCGWAWARGGADGRFWSATWIAGAVLLLAAPGYYVHYAPTLMVSTAPLLAAAATALLGQRVGQRGLVAAALLILVLPTVAAVATRELVRLPRADAGAAIRAVVPAGACVYADPPSLAIAAGRLPGAGMDRPLLDPFGEPLWLALRDRRYASLEDALWSRPAQDRIREALRGCSFVALVGPIAQQRWLSPATRAWLEGQVEPLVAPAGGGVGLWRRR